MAGKIIRSKKTADFVILSTHCLRNTGLSWEAKGLHSYIMQLPDEWQLNIADLKNRSTNGRDATANAMKELVKSGYISRVRVNGEKGKFEGYDYTVFESPNEEAINALAVNGFPVNGLSVDGKPVTSKYEYLPKYEDNLNQSISASAKGKIETVEDIKEDTKRANQEDTKEAVQSALEAGISITPPVYPAAPPSFLPTSKFPKDWQDMIDKAGHREPTRQQYSATRAWDVETPQEIVGAVWAAANDVMFCDMVKKNNGMGKADKLFFHFTDFIENAISTGEHYNSVKELKQHLRNFIPKNIARLAAADNKAKPESKIKEISAADKWRKVVNEAA